MQGTSFMMFCMLLVNIHLCSNTVSPSLSSLSLQSTEMLSYHFIPVPFFSVLSSFSFSHSLQQHHRFLCSFLSLSFCLYAVRVMSVKCPAGFGSRGQKGQNLNSHLPPTGSDLSPNLTQSYHLVLWYSVPVHLSDVLLE